MKNLRTQRLALTCGALMTMAGLSGCFFDVNITAWYDVYGHHCGDGSPHPGCDYYSDGQKAHQTDDPDYHPGLQLTFFTDLRYTDAYGNQLTFKGWGWMSSDGVLYDENGNAVNSLQDEAGRDLIGQVAESEDQVVRTVGKEFAQRFALSEATGIHIARTLNEWATLSRRTGRARTAEDLADFSQRLYGIDASRAQAALASARQGDTSGLEGMSSDVATYWGASPETTRTILKRWYKDQLDEIGVR